MYCSHVHNKLHCQSVTPWRLILNTNPNPFFSLTFTLLLSSPPPLPSFSGDPTFPITIFYTNQLLKKFINFLLLLLPLIMYKRRFNTKPLYVTDPDEPEPEPISEAAPASPSSCEDTKTEEPSPKKRFQAFSFLILYFLYFYGLFLGLWIWKLKVVNRWSVLCFMILYVGRRWRRG